MRRREFLKTGVAAGTVTLVSACSRPAPESPPPAAAPEAAVGGEWSLPAFEQATRHRRAPRFLRTAELVA